MFADAPKGSLLIHACNTQGRRARILQTLLRPNAQTHTLITTTSALKTTAGQIQYPQELRSSLHHKREISSTGLAASSQVRSTVRPRTGLMKLLGRVKSMQLQLELVSQVDDEITDIGMCKINSDESGVPWEKTEEALQDFALKPQWRKMVEVLEPAK